MASMELWLFLLSTASLRSPYMRSDLSPWRPVSNDSPVPRDVMPFIGGTDRLVTAVGIVLLTSYSQIIQHQISHATLFTDTFPYLLGL